MLPKNWMIRGSKEFAGWCKNYKSSGEKVVNVAGSIEDYFYHTNDPLFITWIHKREPIRNHIEISFQQFLSHIGNHYCDYQIF